MIADEVLMAATEAGWPGPVRFLPVTESTNADLIRLAAGAPEWTLLVADHQVAGRGRLGRTWVSSPGKSLTASVLIRPAVDTESLWALSIGAAVSAAEACREACGVAATCKWPNDIMAGDRKLGGILTEVDISEARVRFAVVGSGINVSEGIQDFPPALRQKATSILLEGGDPAAPALLQSYLRLLRDRYGEVVEGGSEGLLDRYRALCQTLGRAVRVDTSSRGRIEGRAVDVGSSGELLVETPSGLEPIRFGEVEHLT